MKVRTRDRNSATSGAGAKELTPVCSHTVRLGLQLNYDDPVAGIALAQEADRLGFHSVWTSEAYGADAVTPMAWIAATTKRVDIGSAVMQKPAPPPPPAGAHGADAVTPMAWIAATTKRVDIGSAIMQMPARSPAATATTVATLDILSGGRVLLGLGTSGPQAAEGRAGQAG